MNRDLQAKFLMHMASKKQGEQGFTLIELLVVIIIIGILAAIALPSLLGQVNKAKQSEARQNVGSMNRAQQAYALEANKFTTDITDLGIGIQQQTVNYVYDAIDGTSAGAADAVIINRGSPLKDRQGLKKYGGAVGIYSNGTESLTIASTFESKKPEKGTATIGSVGSATVGAGDLTVKDLGGNKGYQVQASTDGKYKDLGSGR